MVLLWAVLAFVPVARIVLVVAQLCDSVVAMSSSISAWPLMGEVVLPMVVAVAA